MRKIEVPHWSATVKVGMLDIQKTYETKELFLCQFTPVVISSLSQLMKK